ncbi:MAG TPA: hypothetical protein VF925_02225 [Casimicrobiaceae bacterium]
MVTAMHQRGWLGLIGLVLALVIVALLARTILKEYGLAGNSTATARHVMVPGAPDVESAANITPKNALERARALQDQVRKDAADEEKRIDAATSSK